jgi:DNA polymerase III delta' subunit
MLFTEIKGQKQVVSQLEAALEKERVPHALLFLGPPGSGQREMAQALAQALFCGKKKKASQACGECVNCRQAASGNHPDFRVWEPVDDAKSIKVEEVRQMIGMANLRPYQAPAKVFVIDRAETLGDIAQNALLKTLEEPPSGTYFVLIVYAAEKMLSTIRSRAQTLHFRPAAGSSGGPEEGLDRAKNAVWDRLARGRAAKTPELAGLSREEVGQAIEFGIRGLREALLLRAGAPDLVSEQDLLQKQRLAESADEEELIRRIETLSEFKERIDQSANVKLALSVLWEEL